MREETVDIMVRGIGLTVMGYYTPAVPDQMYDQQGEPGTGGSPAEFEITEVYLDLDFWNLIQVIDMVDGVARSGDSFIEEIEEACITALE